MFAPSRHQARTFVRVMTSSTARSGSGPGIKGTDEISESTCQESIYEGTTTQIGHALSVQQVSRKDPMSFAASAYPITRKNMNLNH